MRIFVINITVLILIPFYGTYLDYCVMQVLEAHPEPLSVKEIAALIFDEHDSPREKRNLQMRIRRSLAQMDQDLLKEEQYLDGNILTFKYKLSKHEKGHELP